MILSGALTEITDGVAGKMKVPVASVRRSWSMNESLEQATHFESQRCHRIEVCLAHVAQVHRYQQQGIDLGQAAAGNRDGLRKLGGVLARLPLGDVRRNRHHCSSQLIAQRVAFLRRQLLHQPIHRGHQLHRLLPGNQLAIPACGLRHPLPSRVSLPAPYSLLSTPVSRLSSLQLATLGTTSLRSPSQGFPSFASRFAHGFCPPGNSTRLKSVSMFALSAASTVSAPLVP